MNYTQQDGAEGWSGGWKHSVLRPFLTAATCAALRVGGLGVQTHIQHEVSGVIHHLLRKQTF